MAEGEIGLVKEFEYKFVLKPDSKGHIEPCRNVSFRVQITYKKELDKLEVRNFNKNRRTHRF